jgi:hypothetical protein
LTAVQPRSAFYSNVQEGDWPNASRRSTVFVSSDAFANSTPKGYATRLRPQRHIFRCPKTFACWLLKHTCRSRERRVRGRGHNARKRAMGRGAVGTDVHALAIEVRVVSVSHHEGRISHSFIRNALLFCARGRRAHSSLWPSSECSVAPVEARARTPQYAYDQRETWLLSFKHQWRRR